MERSDLDYQDNLLDALKDTSEDSLYNDLKIEEDSDNMKQLIIPPCLLNCEIYYNAILDFGIGVMFGYEATKLYLYDYRVFFWNFHAFL